MTCQYCTAKNEPDDERCQRCGRRIHTAHARPAFQAGTISGSSLAHSLSYDAETTPETPVKHQMGPQIVAPLVAAPSVVDPRGARKDASYQPSLFGPQLISGKESPKQSETSRRPPKRKGDDNGQQKLDFIGAIPLGNHALKTSVEARIYCTASIAQTPLRVMAAIADCSVGLIGVAMYIGTFRALGQEMAWSGPELLSYLAAAVVISLFYRVLYCLGNGDTPGTRWAGLRLLDFDGRTPTRQQRFQRLAGGCVGVLAAGLGLWWALFDEEHLTWHDHMSQTFPTPRS